MIFGAAALMASVVYARTEFLTTVDGKRVVGSHVCFSRAGSEGLYFPQFLGDGTEVRCLPADRVLDLPVGAWNYFAYHDDGFVSVHPNHVVVQRETDRYVAGEIAMFPAGKLDISRLVASVPSSTEVVLYFPNNNFDRSPSAIRRAPLDVTDVWVPAGATIVPLAMRGWNPVAVGKPIVVGRGERFVAEPFPMQEPTVIIPVRLQLADNLWITERVGTFDISARTADGQSLQPAVPLRKGIGIERSLAIFRVPTVRNVQVSFTGELWKAATVEVAPQSGSIAVADWLVGVPAAQVRVEWEFAASAEVARADKRPCPAKVEPALVRLVRCTTEAACDVIKEVPDAPMSGVLEAGSLSPGEYRAELTFPPFSPIRTQVSANPAELTAVKETIGQRVVSGIVTRDEKPVAATIVVSGIRTATREADGAFALSVSDALPVIPISVKACDGSFSYTAVPPHPIPAGGRFDIDIPSNSLEVTVVDAKTQEPLAAKVSYSAVHPDDAEADVYSAEVVADEKGLATIEPLAPTHAIRVCATLAGYEQTCASPIKISVTGKLEQRLTLRPYAHVGRVIANGRILAGTVYWVGRDGVVRERIHRVRTDDGTFWFNYEPVPGDYLVVVSQSHPLVVWRPADLQNIAIPVTAPSAPILVEITANYHRATAAPTIAVGGLLVPRDAFAQHGRWRKIADVQRGTAFLIADVVLAGPVVVLLGPTFRDRPVDLPPDADLFALPQYRGLVDSQAPGADGRVVF